MALLGNREAEKTLKDSAKIGGKISIYLRFVFVLLSQIILLSHSLVTGEPAEARWPLSSVRYFGSFPPKSARLEAFSPVPTPSGVITNYRCTEYTVDNPIGSLAVRGQRF